VLKKVKHFYRGSPRIPASRRERPRAGASRGEASGRFGGFAEKKILVGGGRAQEEKRNQPGKTQKE